MLKKKSVEIFFISLLDGIQNIYALTESSGHPYHSTENLLVEVEIGALKKSRSSFWWRCFQCLQHTVMIGIKYIIYRVFLKNWWRLIYTMSLLKRGCNSRERKKPKTKIKIFKVKFMVIFLPKVWNRILFEGKQVQLKVDPSAKKNYWTWGFTR